MSAPEAVLFDLDGVVADSGRAITSCMAAAFTDHGLPAPPAERLRAAIGPPLLEAFTDMAGAELAPRLMRRYRERYAVVSLTATTTYPGVAEALAALHDAGVRLAVCTSKPAPYAEPIVDALGVRRWFEAVFAPSGDVEGEGKTATMARAHAALGVRAPIVGDRHHDADAARAHGVRCVGALWGFGTAEELTAAGADPLLRSPGELAPYLLGTTRSGPRQGEGPA